MKRAFAIAMILGLVSVSSPLIRAADTLDALRGEAVFGAAGDGARSYRRTTRGDYSKDSFRAEVTVTLKGGQSNGCAFFGMGKGVADPAFYNEPASAPSLYLRLCSSDFAGGEISAGAGAGEPCEGSSPVGDGTHRLRLTWDAVGKRALFEVCRNWDGKHFHPDAVVTADAASIVFGTEGCLFVGGANGDAFSDFSVEPLTAREIKSTPFGESFLHDPSAGTWLAAAGAPATDPGPELAKLLKPIAGSVRLLSCWYAGPRLIATRTHGPQGVRTAASRWTSKLEARPVAGEDDALDLTLTFNLAEGNAASAGVGIAFDFADWDAGNYVLIPGSVYNGNRERIVGGGYASGLPRSDLYRKDLPLSVRQLPHLELEAGGPSRIEVNACNATTPAMCFYNHKTRRAFMVLAEQGVHIGGKMLDNGLMIEESPDRSRASFVVTAPGVRGQKPEFIGFGGSPDRGVNWKAGDTLTLHLRVYSFETSGIPRLLDKFMTARKTVTGPNHPRNLIPLSEITRLLANRINGRFYNGADSQFYCPENAAWISFGWVGGLMDTFPMLALGDEPDLERVTQTFDFAIAHGQGKAGYFYGALNHDGKPFGREGYDDHPEICLTRKNADVLFWMVKQFNLLKAQGRGGSIKPQWEQATRRVADAFVKTWKRDGQWGNFVNVDTGDVAVFNSSSGVMAVGGLALASQYYHDPEYLRVAEEAADFYYQRDVVALGMTTGACADILQNADSETAAGFMTALMALYETTGDPAWLEKSRTLANHVATWVVSYDYELPPDTELARLGAKLCGAVWASTQNKHGAPGFCTSSGDPLFKIYRATGDLRYAQLMHDVLHAHAEGIKGGGEITERLTYCDADSRGSRGGGSTGWNELNGILMAMELPGIYLQTDSDRFFVFDHVEAQVIHRDGSGMTIKITNPTRFPARVSIFAESSKQAGQPLGYTAFLNWPKVDVKAGDVSFVRVTHDGKVIPRAKP